MTANLPIGLIVPLFSFGVMVLGGIGWLIRISYTAVKSFRDGQELQNKTLVKIETELEWWRNFRERNEAEMKSAWGKIDRHDDILHDHASRIAKVEALR